MIKFTNIQIGRVSNGWIVIGSPKPGAAAAPEDTVLVQDDEDLAGAIAAALVAGKFKASDSPATETAQVGNLLQGAAGKPVEISPLQQWNATHALMEAEWSREEYARQMREKYANAALRNNHKSFV